MLSAKNKEYSPHHANHAQMRIDLVQVTGLKPGTLDILSGHDDIDVHGFAAARSNASAMHQVADIANKQAAAYQRAKVTGQSGALLQKGGALAETPPTSAVGAQATTAAPAASPAARSAPKPQ